MLLRNKKNTFPSLRLTIQHNSFFDHWLCLITMVMITTPAYTNKNTFNITHSYHATSCQQFIPSLRFFQPLILDTSCKPVSRASAFSPGRILSYSSLVISSRIVQHDWHRFLPCVEFSLISTIFLEHIWSFWMFLAIRRHWHQPSPCMKFARPFLLHTLSLGKIATSLSRGQILPSWCFTLARFSGILFSHGIHSFSPINFPFKNLLISNYCIFRQIYKPKMHINFLEAAWGPDSFHVHLSQKPKLDALHWTKSITLAKTE